MLKGERMKIKIMSIQDLLRIPYLKSSYEHAIIFVTTNPNYYDFGCTRFLHLYIADTNAPVISDCDFQQLYYFANVESKTFETIYVCCDAGLSRSPAVALFILYIQCMNSTLDETFKLNEILEKYQFLNKHLFDKLKEMSKKT